MKLWDILSVYTSFYIKCNKILEKKMNNKLYIYIFSIIWQPGKSINIYLYDSLSILLTLASKAVIMVFVEVFWDILNSRSLTGNSLFCLSKIFYKFSNSHDWHRSLVRSFVILYISDCALRALSIKFSNFVCSSTKYTSIFWILQTSELTFSSHLGVKKWKRKWKLKVIYFF